MQKEQVSGENIRWNLEFLYKSVDDPQIDLDITSWIEAAKAFHANHNGKLVQTLPQAIRDYITLSAIGDKPVWYLSLRQALNTGDTAVQAKIALVEKQMNPIDAEYLEFLAHELVEIDDTAIEAHAKKDPFVAKHISWLEKVRQSKPHLLSEPVEAALGKRRSFGSGAWAGFFDEVEADLRFTWKREKKTLTEMLHISNYDPDVKVRAAALKVINNGFAGYFVKYSAQTLHMVAGAVEVEIRERKYRHPMDGRNISNQLPDAVVDVLHKTVMEKAGPLAKRFYKLKANILHRRKLRWSDRNAPMPFADTAIVSWNYALETVLAAYQSFSPTLAKIVNKMVADGCIDAPTMPGKQGGAFNSSNVLANGAPVSMTFLNFFGSREDIMTLAHELGHGVHGILAGQAQGPLMQHAPTALSETASIFGEMTTFMFLKKQLADAGEREELLALLMKNLDGMMNTVVRQIGFSNFERRLHGWDPATGQWKGSQKFSVSELDALWLETVYELYGQPGEVFTYKDVEHLWAYISHFHRPFYVYGYSFGELLTQSLYAARSRIGDSFEPLYLDMLRAGNIKNVTQLLEPFGLNPEDPAFWEDGIKVSMEAMLEEAEQLARELGLVK